jgi:hypothetical protein
VDAIDFCIQIDETGSANWFDAVVGCKASEGRLCDPQEWYYACTERVALGLNDMLDDDEWTSVMYGDPTAGGAVAAGVVLGGTGFCTSRTVVNLGAPNIYRCCQ